MARAYRGEDRKFHSAPFGIDQVEHAVPVTCVGERRDVGTLYRYVETLPATKRATIYLEARLHRALRLKSAESDVSVSELVNAAIRNSLADDADDLGRRPGRHGRLRRQSPRHVPAVNAPRARAPRSTRLAFAFAAAAPTT